MTDAGTTQDNFIPPAPPVGGLPLSQAYDAIFTDIYDFWDSNLQSFHALYSNCCQFAMTPAILREHESKWSVTQQVVFCLFIVYECLIAGSYTTIVFCNGVDNL